MTASTRAARASRILIVDDEPGVAAFVARVAQRSFPAGESPVVQTATSPDEALRLLDASPASDGPVVVVSDYNMGPQRQNGLQLLDEVQHRRPDSRCVLMSGYAQEDFDARLRAVHVDAFVPKPFDMAALRALLVRLVDGGDSPAADSA